jgi:hypothetical protein
MALGQLVYNILGGCRICYGGGLATTMIVMIISITWEKLDKSKQELLLILLWKCPDNLSMGLSQCNLLLKVTYDE